MTESTVAKSSKLAFRLAAAVAASLLVAGCGTRLNDSQIEAAAGVGGSGGGGAAATGSAAPGTVDTGTVSDTGAAQASTGAAAVSGGAAAAPVAGAAVTPGAGASSPANTGAARTSAGQAAAPTASQAKGTAGPSTAAAGGGATPGTPGPGAAPAPGASAGTPVVIGNIGDYSGIIGTLMKGGNVMAAVVARYVNEHGGLSGHPMQVVTGDAGGDPARALSLVRDMVENKGVVALMGNLWVFSANGPRQYLEEHKVPVIGGDGTTRVWDQSPMYFSSGSPYPAMAMGAMKGLADLGHKKQAIIYCVEAEQCGAWRDIAKKHAAEQGVDIVYEAQVSLAQPDFTAECIQAQRNGATGIQSAVDGPSIARLAKACAQQGYKPQYMGISLAIIDSISSEPALEGLMAPQGNFPFTSASTPQEAEYQAIRQQFAPSLANSPAVATVWAAGALLREAVKGAALPAGKVTSRDLLNGLYTIKDDNLAGLSGTPLTFVEGQQPKKLVNCLFYIRLTGAKWTAPYGSKSICLGDGSY
ncbi:MAG TPA: ABC transporter substrate-binding protein [Acidimicrobiia bacterium]|nr:ABC transporter substrate-binding protein [Acidimicrobiia bacterium]